MKFKQIITESENIVEATPAKMDKKLQKKIEKLRDLSIELWNETAGKRYGFDYKYYINEIRKMAIKINNQAMKDLEK